MRGLGAILACALACNIIDGPEATADQEEPACIAALDAMALTCNNAFPPKLYEATCFAAADDVRVECPSLVTIRDDFPTGTCEVLESTFGQWVWCMDTDAVTVCNFNAEFDADLPWCMDSCNNFWQVTTPPPACN